MMSCRLQSNYGSTITQHGGPVVLRTVMLIRPLMKISRNLQGRFLTKNCLLVKELFSNNFFFYLFLVFVQAILHCG